MKKDDRQLRRDVLDELEWEPSIDATEIGLAAHDGVVTLTGMVPTFAEKVVAERATKRVHGVKAVANDIEVCPPGFSDHNDTEIARAAAEALGWKTSVPRDRVKVSVTKGWITLEGEVDWHYQKEAAEDTVRHLPGVRGVLNQVTLKPHPSATEIRSRIEAAFKRSAELDSQKIRVQAAGSKVTLCGELHSWGERQQAEQTAWSAPGVTEVENLIMITPRGT
jgi:osmotically-inducible protein OsmY